MRAIQASEAKTHLPQLLDDVEHGETLIITRHGRAIARIVPDVDRRQTEIEQAIESIQQLRKRTGRVSVEDLLHARDEGRRY
jgi:prevent-host-death family protein